MMPTIALTRLNPFRSLPNPRAVWAWGMYDLANQSFQLLINTLLSSIYFAHVIVGDPPRGERLWSVCVAAATLGVAALSPLLGALADDRAWKRELLLATGVVSAALTACLAFLGRGDLALAAALYVTAALACGLGENFLGSFLPEISTPRNVGFVSALGWTMSYVGALLLLGITAVYFFGFGRSDVSQMRPLFVFAGVWFALGMLPAVLWLHERAQPRPPTASSAIARAVRTLANSVRETGRFRDLARFLAAFFVYGMGVKAAIFFLGLIGTSLGSSLGGLILFALVMAGAAGVAAAITARVQDRVGHRRTILAFLALWTIGALCLAAARAGGMPAWSFWAVSGVIGLALGGIGTASRAVVGLFTPEDRAAEFFGVWGLCDKLSGVAGVLAFGMLPESVRLYVLAGFFVAGAALLVRVDERAGARAARPDEERPNGRGLSSGDAR